MEPIRGCGCNILGKQDKPRDVDDNHHHQEGDDGTLPGGEASLNYNKNIYLTI